MHKIILLLLLLIPAIGTAQTTSKTYWGYVYTNYSDGHKISKEYVKRYTSETDTLMYPCKRIEYDKDGNVSSVKEEDDFAEEYAIEVSNYAIELDLIMDDYYGITKVGPVHKVGKNYDAKMHKEAIDSLNIKLGINEVMENPIAPFNSKTKLIYQALASEYQSMNGVLNQGSMIMNNFYRKKQLIAFVKSLNEYNRLLGGGEEVIMQKTEELKKIRKEKRAQNPSFFRGLVQDLK